MNSYISSKRIFNCMWSAWLRCGYCYGYMYSSVNDDDDQLHVIADVSYTRFMTSSVAEEASSNTHKFVHNVRVSFSFSLSFYISLQSPYLYLCR